MRKAHARVRCVVPRSYILSGCTVGNSVIFFSISVLGQPFRYSSNSKLNLLLLLPHCALILFIFCRARRFFRKPDPCIVEIVLRVSRCSSQSEEELSLVVFWKNKTEIASLNSDSRTKNNTSSTLGSEIGENFFGFVDRRAKLPEVPATETRVRDCVGADGDRAEKSGDFNEQCEYAHYYRWWWPATFWFLTYNGFM